MSCSHCGSGNVRLGERGVIRDEYYCNDCKRTFTRFSRPAKTTALSVGGGLLLGPIGVILGVILGGGSDADEQQ